MPDPDEFDPRIIRAIALYLWPGVERETNPYEVESILDRAAWLVRHGDSRAAPLYRVMAQLVRTVEEERVRLEATL